MAAPADPQTEAYRMASVTVAGVAALYAAQALQAVDLTRLLPSFEEFLDTVTGPTTAAAVRLTSLARQDFFATREGAGLTSPRPAWQAQQLSPAALRRSLYATVGQTLQGIERHQVAAGAAMKRARIEAQGVVIRQTMNVARNSTIATAKIDPDAIGALYVTKDDDKVCSWCLMLASRGPVFGDDSYEDADRLFTGTGTAKSHDACRCVLKAVYAGGSPLLDRAHELEAAWRDVNWAPGWRANPTQPMIRNSGKKALNAWRRHVAARRKAGDPLFGGRPGAD